MVHTLMTPVHVHGIRTAEEYRALQRRHLHQVRMARPAWNVPDPQLATEHPPVIVSGGKWLIVCPCGNGPSVHPEWALALCFDCGKVYEGLTMPEDAAGIEAALMQRPHLWQRQWAPGETVGDLLAENAALGVSA